jgi:hypothetical protein
MTLKPRILLLLVLVAGLLTAPRVFSLWAQTSSVDQAATTQALLTEVRMLRITLEKSMLSVPRLQLAYQRVQEQEQRVDALKKDLDQRQAFARQGGGLNATQQASISIATVSLQAGQAVLDDLTQKVNDLERQLQPQVDNSTSPGKQ